jgi:hypothetical protein
LTDLKRLLSACRDEGIEAALWAEEGCATGGCGGGPKIHLITPPSEAPKVSLLLQRQWAHALEREGTLLPTGGESSEDPPCPACGSTKELEQGACPECGLQLA